MGRVSHKYINTYHKVVTLSELATYLCIHRHTLTVRLGEFKKARSLDLKNAYDVFDFVRWYDKNY